MEQTPRHSEEISPQISQSTEGIDIVIDRRNTWHFTTIQEALRYFRRQQLEYRALHWGIRILFLSAVANVVRDIDQVVQHHDTLAVVAAVTVGTISIIAEGINERDISGRVRIHREVLRRFKRELGQ